MKAKELPLFRDPRAKKKLQEICAKHEITPQLLANLIEVERDHMGMGRAEGITGAIEDCVKDFIEAQGG